MNNMYKSLRQLSKENEVKNILFPTLEKEKELMPEDGVIRKAGYNTDGTPFIKPDNIEPPSEREPFYESIPYAMAYYGIHKPHNVPGTSQQFLVYYWVSSFAKRYKEYDGDDKTIINLLKYYDRYKKATRPYDIRDLMHEVDDYCRTAIPVKYIYKNKNRFYSSRVRTTIVISCWLKHDIDKTVSGYKTIDNAGLYHDRITFVDDKNVFYKDLKTSTTYRWDSKKEKLIPVKVTNNYHYPDECEIKYFNSHTVYRDMNTGDLYRISKSKTSLIRTYIDKNNTMSDGCDEY